MITVAIICEYNPFHNGHLHQIEAIRREFGEDTRIIAIMSGSFTQRGESAIMDKFDRAKCAVLSGVNLVLELPFPFSMSSAELFATAGVAISDSLGIVDYLSFGSESGDISAITEYAERTLSKEYLSLLDRMTNEPSNSALGYARLCEMAYSALYGKPIALSPNNILAIEYVKAIIRRGSKIKPHTVRREGADYNSTSLSEVNPSATAIRREVLGGNISALGHVPAVTREVLLDALRTGAFPCDMERLAPAVLSFFRLSPTDAPVELHDAKGGLYNRLRATSLEADNIKTLVSLSETKKYTNARILRATWYSFFGVTSSDVKDEPRYTQLLAMDGTGRSCLKEIRKRGSLAVVTKPSDTDGLSDTAKRQKALSDRADSIFHLTRPSAVCGNHSLRCSPYVKS